MPTATMTQETNIPSCRPGRQGHPRRFPDPAAPRPRGAAGLSGQRGDLAETAAGDRTPTHHDENTNANVHRGVHTLSEEATTHMRGAGAEVAVRRRVLPEGMIWTRNASEALNLVAYSWGRANLKRATAPADRDGASLEPRAVADPGGRAGLRDRLRACGRRRHPDPGRPAQAAEPRTKLFSFTAMSNVLGTINPVKELPRPRTSRARRCTWMPARASRTCR